MRLRLGGKWGREAKCSVYKQTQAVCSNKPKPSWIWFFKAVVELNKWNCCFYKKPVSLLRPEQQMNVVAAASRHPWVPAHKYILHAATATSPVLNGIFPNNKLELRASSSSSKD